MTAASRLDNNAVERSIRPIALNRKNALFAGSDGGAEHWAIIASLIETCKLNDVDPLAYLDRRPHQDRQRPSQQRDRPAAAVGLSATSRPQSRGLRTPLTIELLWIDLKVSRRRKQYCAFNAQAAPANIFARSCAGLNCRWSRLRHGFGDLLRTGQK